MSTPPEHPDPWNPPIEPEQSKPERRIGLGIAYLVGALIVVALLIAVIR